MFGIDQRLQQTADAYRGKPEMLEQKYAQNQQLIDLLALQKLKSEKEEASRQMALQMGGQGKPPTIADQRESQVLDMTKKEIVDQQAGVMQQKMQQQQAAQQKLLQSAGAPQMPAQAAPQQQPPQQPPAAGLAGLAAPNIQGMAGGGIVAFGDGGSTDKEKEQRERDRAAVTNTIEQLIAAGKDVLTAPGRGIAGAAESVITRPLRAAGVPLPYLPESFYGGDRESLTPYADKLAKENAANQAINASRRLPADEATPAYAGAVARQAEARDAAQPPAPPPQAAPQSTSGGAPSNAPGTVGFGIQSLIGTKTPEEAARENEARAAAAANYTPEDAATKRQDNQEKTAAYERNKFNRMLMAMAGQTSNYGAIAAGGAQAENDADQAMRERHRGNNEFINVGLASRIAGTKAGEARYKDVVTGMGHGVDAAVRMAANATMAAGNMLKQKELDYNHAMQRINDFTKGQNTALYNLEKNYITQKSKIILPGSTPTPQQKRDAEIMDTKYEIDRSRLSKTPVEITSLRNRIGIPSYEGYSLVDTQNPAPKT